ncbi:MAG: alkaline phosphatase family protein, partial [Actinocrinis sp.]
YQDAGDGLDGPGFWGWTSDAYIGNYGDNSLLYFDQYRDAAPGDPLYDRARVGTNAKGGQDFFENLTADVKSGALPQVSWVVAPEAFTEHPNWPANYGAWYASKVLDALTSDPEVWAKTALFITYDENDGFFDHSVPAFAPTSRAQGLSTVDTVDELFTAPDADGDATGPYGLGVRVPMLVVSPWSKGGWVCSEVFDHTSIIRFLERRFGVHEPNISPWRRAVCGDLTAAFDFSATEPRVPALPDTGGYFPPDRKRHADYVPALPANPALPTQEPGLRAARPLPYDLAADAAVTGGRLRIAFANRGAAGAAFLVTSATHPAGPWTYTVEAGKSLADTWDVAADGKGAYDFTVHGPNGFERRFQGRASSAGVEVAAVQVCGEDTVELTLVNKGATTARLTVTDGYSAHDRVTHSLRPGAHTTHVANVRRTNGWYDLSVASDEDASFTRQFAGHVENGKPSTSDPAIGAK